jgi:hypothetical protein
MDTSRSDDVTWRTVAPISLVTCFAVYGQFQFGLDAFRQDWFPLTVVIAGGAAAAFESISLYVQWHAHDALLRKDTATAAKYRRWSYLLAGVAAAVNYSHFSTGWAPSPAAVMFALFSLSSPWLWGLHTRRAHHIQLSVEGRLDDTGALFSAERWRHFPWRTLGARRWSIDQGITDPREAWESYRVERARRQDAHTVGRVDVPALERVEDVVVPDLSQVDDNGLSLRWQTAPRATTTPDGTSSRGKETSSRGPVAPPRDIDLDKARELIAGGAGRVVLQKKLGVTEHTAKQLVKSLSVNGHQPA